MEINDFDKLVKEQMSKMEVVPSKGIKKALVFKMFFNNLFLFHKVKLVAALFLISSGVYLGVTYSESEANSFSEGKNELVTEEVDVNKSAVQNNNLADYSVKDEINSEGNLQKEIAPKQNVYKGIIKEAAAKRESSSQSSKENQRKEALNLINTTTKQLITSNQKEATSSKGDVNVTPLETEEQVDKDVSERPNSKSDIVGSNQLKTTASNSGNNFSMEPKISTNKSIQKFAIIEPVLIETEIVLNNSLPSPIAIQPIDDYVTNPKKRGFTIDAYYSTLNKVDIDNTLDDDLSDYHWDFYKEYDYVKTGSRGGVNINYNWNNFKIGSGIQLSTLRDYKSVYKYYFMEGSSSGGITTPTISSAVVYGEDTAQVFYADPLNHELHREIENEYNTYTYIKVPLTLGYEFDFKYLSLELNAGVEYGHLINSSGVEVKRGNVVNDPVPVYFYSDKYIGMMSRESENLNKHQLAILANATLRVRLSPSFDLYSSVHYSQSKTGIYSDNYFMQKMYKNYGAKIGVTYYLNKRLTLNETTRASF
jgi:hypothetical protein